MPSRSIWAGRTFVLSLLAALAYLALVHALGRL
jgi:hypothetical protein